MIEPGQSGPDGAGEGCLICGHAPVAEGRLAQETGLLLFRRTRAIEGPLCRECGIARFRRLTNRTLLTGWWGVISFFVNLATIARNLSFRRRLGRLGQPLPHMSGPDLLDKPLDRGSPLIARPGAWLGIVLIGFIVSGAVAGITGRADRDTGGEIVGAGSLSASDLRVGDCVQEPRDEDFLTVEAIPCEEPHDFELFHRFEMAPGDYPDDEAFAAAVAAECPPALGRYLGGERPAGLEITTFLPSEGAWRDGDRSVSCVGFAADGSQLSRSISELGGG